MFALTSDDFYVIIFIYIMKVMFMAKFADIHCHMLYGLDDGAAQREDMIAMLTAAHQSGTEAICFTPHYEPESFAYTGEQLVNRFEEAKAYAAEHFPSMKLYLGNELSYRFDCVDRLLSGECLSLAGGRYVLIDFFGVSGEKEMATILEKLWCAGYIPVVAHVERYDFLRGKLRELVSLSNEGVIFQINSHSLVAKEKGAAHKKMAEKLLARGLVDVIASDSHDRDARAPELKTCYEYVSGKYGEDYARALLYENPMCIINNQIIRV